MGKSGKDKKSGDTGLKARLAAELRANLKRRKARLRDARDARDAQDGQASAAQAKKKPD